MSTAAQIHANRENAVLSTGPKTEAGKSRSSLNAVKTGLTGRTVLLSSDDADAYRAHVASHEARWNPTTDEERNLVQMLADTMWRLLRIPSLESGIYALGRLESAGLFPDHNDAEREVLLNAFIFRKHKSELSNLTLQESRLRRQLEKDTQKLEALQQERAERKKALLPRAAALYRTAKKENKPFDHAAFGFVFSNAELEKRIEEEDRVARRRAEIHAIADAQSGAVIARAQESLRNSMKR